MIERITRDYEDPRGNEVVEKPDFTEIKKIPHASKATRKAARRIFCNAEKAAGIMKKDLTPGQDTAVRIMEIYKKSLGVNARTKQAADIDIHGGEISTAGLYDKYSGLSRKKVDRILNHYIRELANNKIFNYISEVSLNDLSRTHAKATHRHGKPQK